MSESKQLTINMLANLSYMAINYFITFFLTSYIVSNISGEAYGFIGLCNNIINYATLLTVSLNSVAGRFITIEIHKGNSKKANEYFSSTLAANIILAIIIIVIILPISINLDSIFKIPDNLIIDVKRLFIITSFNLIVSVFSTVFTVSTFITNKLYLSSIANLFGIIIRASVLYIFFNTLLPNITYVGLASLIGTLIVWGINILYSKKLCPYLSLKKTDILFKRTKELFVSGIWSTVTKLSQILSDGMDLLFSNLWIGSYAMGQLSIAYTLPTFVSQFLSMIINLFSPKLTENYAKNNIEIIINELHLNMKMTGFFGNVVFFGITFMGKDFFKLWVPDANLNLVFSLALIASSSVLVSSVCSPLSNVFLLVNKLKVNSLIWLIAGIFDAGIVVLLVNFTQLGVYAVAGVSKFVAIIIYLSYWPLYTSKYLKVKSTIFYRLIIRYAFVSIVMGIVLGIIKQFFLLSENWGDFLTQSITLGIVGIVINYFLFLEHDDRVYLKNVIMKRLKK